VGRCRVQIFRGRARVTQGIHLPPDFHGGRPLNPPSQDAHSGQRQQMRKEHMPYGARVEGCNWWQWVFISDSAVYHTIVPTRSASEIATVMGQLRVEAWVCDCYRAQLKAPARVFQLCLAHQLRDLQRALDANPRERWASAMQKLFRSAIHLRNRFNDKQS